MLGMKRFFSSSKLMPFLAIDVKNLAPNRHRSSFKLLFTHQIFFAGTIASGIKSIQLMFFSLGKHMHYGLL